MKSLIPQHRFNQIRLVRMLASAALGGVLLQTPTCLDQAQRAVIVGFFNGAIPFLIEEFEDNLQDVDLTPNVP